MCTFVGPLGNRFLSGLAERKATISVSDLFTRAAYLALQAIPEGEILGVPLFADVSSTNPVPSEFAMERTEKRQGAG